MSISGDFRASFPQTSGFGKGERSFLLGGGGVLLGESFCNPNPHIQGKHMNKHVAEDCRFPFLSDFKYCSPLCLVLWGGGVPGISLGLGH